MFNVQCFPHPSILLLISISIFCRALDRIVAAEAGVIPMMQAISSMLFFSTCRRCSTWYCVDGSSSSFCCSHLSFSCVSIIMSGGGSWLSARRCGCSSKESSRFLRCLSIQKCLATHPVRPLACCAEVMSFLMAHSLSMVSCATSSAVMPSVPQPLQTCRAVCRSSGTSEVNSFSVMCALFACSDV